MKRYIICFLLSLAFGGNLFYNAEASTNRIQVYGNDVLVVDKGTLTACRTIDHPILKVTVDMDQNDLNRYIYEFSDRVSGKKAGVWYFRIVKTLQYNFDNQTWDNCRNNRFSDWTVLTGHKYENDILYIITN